MDIHGANRLNDHNAANHAAQQLSAEQKKRQSLRHQQFSNLLSDLSMDQQVTKAEHNPAVLLEQLKKLKKSLPALKNTMHFDAMIITINQKINELFESLKNHADNDTLMAVKALFDDADEQLFSVQIKTIKQKLKEFDL